MKNKELSDGRFFFNLCAALLASFFILTPVFALGGDEYTTFLNPRKSLTNLIQDGGFETGSSGIWDDYSSLFKENIYQDEASAHSGEWFIWIAGGDDYGGAENAYVGQNVIIPKAEKAELIFWFQIFWAYTPGMFKVKIDEQEIYIATDADEYYEWAAVQIDVSQFADGNAHYLKFEANILEGEGSTDFLLDDVSLTTGYDPSSLTGDADGNGEVNIFDALIIAEFDVGLKTAAQIPGFAFADVDKSGAVDIYDALGIAKFDAGLISSFDELNPPPDTHLFAVFSDTPFCSGMLRIIPRACRR